MSCNLHHSVAHRGSEEYAGRSHYYYGLECGHAGSDGGIEEVYRVIADSGDQVEDGQNEEEGCETEIDAVHKLLCFRQQISANRVI